MPPTSHDPIALIEHRLASIEDSHTDLKDAIKELTIAINKLAIIDDRQVQSVLVMDKLSAAVDKAHSRIDSLTSEFAKALEKAKEDCAAATKGLEERVKVLEIQSPTQKKTTEWVEKIQWLIVGSVFTALVGLVVIKP